MTLTALALLFQLGAPQGEALPPADTATTEISAAAGVAPDTVTVGDPFRAVVRLRVPAGARVDFPEFRMADPVEAVAPVEASGDSSGAWSGTYRLVAWSTGDSMTAAITLGVTGPDGERTSYRIRVPMPVVRSVLPADSALHLPRPAKAVIPIATPDAGRRGWLLPVLALAALLGLIAWGLLRRRGGMALPADPRDAALARLKEIDRAGHLERGEVVLYHVHVSRVLREYLAIRGLGGEDRTSSEILTGARAAGMPKELLQGLERTMRQADRVKFSGSVAPDPAVARAFGGDVARWIRAWPAPAGAPVGARSEAA